MQTVNGRYDKLDFIKQVAGQLYRLKVIALDREIDVYRSNSARPYFLHDWLERFDGSLVSAVKVLNNARTC